MTTQEIRLQTVADEIEKILKKYEIYADNGFSVLVNLQHENLENPNEPIVQLGIVHGCAITLGVSLIAFLNQPENMPIAMAMALNNEVKVHKETRNLDKEK